VSKIGDLAKIPALGIQRCGRQTRRHRAMRKPISGIHLESAALMRHINTATQGFAVRGHRVTASRVF
jgi:hypothetical protein